MAVGRILVLAEHHNGQPTATTLECVSAASTFSQSVDAVSHGTGGLELAAVLGAYGVGRVYDLGDLGDRLVSPTMSAAVERLVAEREPDAIFAPTSYDGRDVMARLSARLDRPVLTNVVGLELVDGSFVSSHSVFGGSETVRARFTAAGPGLYLIRPKSFVAAPGEEGTAEHERVEQTAPGPTDRARVVARYETEASGPPLDGAKIVVAGGRGLGSADEYGLVVHLAQLLGGAAAASRAVVDAGWVPYAYQVGQTGKIVAPEAYLAFGISGATQHLVGMKGSRHVIAVNKDDRAPIFALADLGIVGDVHEVLPKLIAALEARAAH